MNAERQTIQKQIVLEELRKMAEHPTADELYERVRKRLPTISLGTVYRNLEKLAAAGEIRKVESAGTARRFDGDLQPHVHVQCKVCGRVDDLGGDLRIPALQDMLGAADTPFDVDGFVILFQGKCPDCAG